MAKKPYSMVAWTELIMWSDLIALWNYNSNNKFNALIEVQNPCHYMHDSHYVTTIILLFSIFQPSYTCTYYKIGICHAVYTINWRAIHLLLELIMGAFTPQLVLCFLLLSAVVQAVDPPPIFVYRMDYRNPDIIKGTKSMPIQPQGYPFNIRQLQHIARSIYKTVNLLDALVALNSESSPISPPIEH